MNRRQKQNNSMDNYLRFSGCHHLFQQINDWTSNLCELWEEKIQRERPLNICI